MTDFKFDSRKTALLNIDMQNCFVEEFTARGAA